ncbi:hypothetical protein F4604DRAFT_1576188 [Suillus subluteus]|nr:hypothetical protein F4604DRAFT_1576188 [Suillus subluteus]
MLTLRPITTICGTTGVRKSKLSIELALKLAQGMQDGETRGSSTVTRDADSMQVCTGMNVITNKVPVAERMGVEHLLMDFKQPGEQYVVGQLGPRKAIDETHRMDMIPIIVGGTTSYWIQYLIFPNRLSTQSISGCCVIVITHPSVQKPGPTSRVWAQVVVLTPRSLSVQLPD